MKILKIKLKNLNSLKGTHELDFTNAPLQDCGLFVITGNTGAGKSTILDAITLALFGRVPRFESRTAEEVLTHGMKECYAEVTFASQGKQYSSRWSIQKNSKGNLKRAHREIADAQTNKILAKGTRDANRLIPKLLQGLEFEHFVRSVMLAQGDFVAFLKGTEDRSQILERLTNSERYSQLSKAAHLRHKEAETALEREKNRIEEVQLLTDEDVENIQNELEEAEKNVKHIAKDNKQLQDQLQAIEQIEKWQAQKEKLQQSLQEISEKQKALTKDFERLAQHQKAQPFEQDWQKIQQLQKEATNTNKSLEEVATTLEEKQSRLNQLEEQKEDLQQTLQKAKEAYADFQEIYDQVLQLDTTIDATQQTTQQTASEKKTFEKKLEKEKKTAQTLKAAQQEIQKNQEKISAWLEEHQRFESLTKNETIATLEHLSNNLHNYEKELNKDQEKKAAFVQTIDKSQKSIRSLKKKKEKAQKALEKTEATYQALCKDNQLHTEASHQDRLNYLNKKNKDSEKLLESLDELQKIATQKTVLHEEISQTNEELEILHVALYETDWQYIELEKIVKKKRKEKSYYQGTLDEQKQKKSLSSLRGSLDEGQECPLCFATEHPFRSMDNVDIDFAIKQAEKDVQKAEKACTNAEKDLQELSSDQRLIIQKTQQLQNQQAADLKQLTELEAQVQQITKDRNYLSVLQILHDEHQLAEEISSIKTQKKKSEELKDTLQKEYNHLLSQQKEVDSTHKRLEDAQEYLQNYQKELEELTQDIKQHQQNSKAAKEKIQQTLQPFELDGSLNEQVKQLKSIKLNFQKKQTSWEDNRSSIKELSIQLTHATEQIEEVSQDITTKEEKLATLTAALKELKQKRFELLGDQQLSTVNTQHKNTIKTIEKQVADNDKKGQALKASKNKLEGQQAESKKRQQKLTQTIAQEKPKLLEALQEVDITSFQQLQELLLPKEEVTQIKEQKNTLEEKQRLYQQQKKEVSQQLEAAQEVDISQKQSIADKLEVGQEQQQQINQTIGGLSERLKQQAVQKKKHQALLQKIEKLHQEERKWYRLRSIIGSANGKKFRLFAQSITLRKLIQLANKHLSYFLNGRYFLQKRQVDYSDSKPTEFLEIDIVDTFQANNKRPLKTLSGGESFLASLALALGLADMAGNNTSIESLFIDEGFGTLDADTLKVAIKALQSLQATGKTIGVISHVEQLKNNIDTQVQVIKQGGGFSTIDVV